MASQTALPLYISKIMAAQGMVPASTLEGTRTDDSMEGTAADELVLGRLGRDQFGGSSGQDSVFGGRGADHLDGGAGQDTVFGGRGPDILTSQADGGASDVLSGSRGADEFRFDVSGGSIGNDVITDFKKAAGDTLVVSGQGFTTDVTFYPGGKGKADDTTVITLFDDQSGGSQPLGAITVNGRLTADDIIVKGATSPGPGSHLYVSTTGSDANDGSDGSPFRTIQAAADAATPGTTVHVAPGTYNETINSLQDGTADAPIRYLSDTPGGAVIKPKGASGTIWSDSGDHVTIEGFDIDGGASASVRSGMYLTGAHSSAVGNEVHGINQAGANDSQGGGGIILGGGYYGNADQHAIGNHVYDIGGGGFFQGIYHQSTGSVVNNVVHDVNGMAVSLWHDPRDITIANNTVYDNSYGIGFGAGDWYGPNNPADNIRIVNNIAYNNGIGIGDMGSVGPNNVVNHNMSVGNGTNYNLQSGTAHTNDVGGTPGFINYSAGNVQLATGSAAIDAGTAVGAPNVDKDGAARDTPDLGAYEWQAT